MGNFSSIKVSVAFEETYTGTEGDGREDRFQALLAVATEKLDEVANVAKTRFKVIKDGANPPAAKNQITLNEDDF